MDKNVKRIFFEVLDKTKSLQDCQKSKCKKEYSATMKQAKEVQSEMLELMRNVGKKKMAVKEFVKKTDKIKQRVLTSNETKNLQLCTLQNCEKKAKDMLTSMAKTKLYDCKTKKKKEACVQYKKTQAILNKKKLSVSDYANFVKVIS